MFDQAAKFLNCVLEIPVSKVGKDIVSRILHGVIYVVDMADIHSFIFKHSSIL
jgi:hypothetical protein